jgi:hypothetical protein
MILMKTQAVSTAHTNPDYSLDSGALFFTFSKSAG